jgi:hypothetical protein
MLIMMEQKINEKFCRHRRKQIKLKKSLFNGVINEQVFEEKIKKYLNDNVIENYCNLLIKIRCLGDILRPFRKHRKEKIDKIFETLNYTDSIASRTREFYSRHYYSQYKFAYHTYHADYGISFLYYPNSCGRHNLL